MRFFLLLVAALAATPLVSKLISASPNSGTFQVANQAQRERSRLFGFGAIKDILLRVYRGNGEHGLSLLAAGVAFYALFAIFPALGAATWIFGLLSDPATIHNQLDGLRDVLPAEAWNAVDQQLRTLAARSSSFSLTGIASLLIALFSARAAASSMIQALNTVFGVRETRGFIKTNMLAILLTLLAIAVLLIAAGVLIVIPIVFSFFGLSSVTAVLLRYARWPALAMLMSLALALLYRYGPNRDNAKWKWLTWGSATATAIWLIASFGFSWYVSAFNSYDKVYGSIGAVVVLLFWLWITAFSGLLGAELDNAIERSAGDAPANPGSSKTA
jgi:membrane protein